MFWQMFLDPEEWAEPDQLSTHNLLLKLIKSISKEHVVIVQANVNLICSCLQGFLAVFFLTCIL